MNENSNKPALAKNEEVALDKARTTAALSASETITRYGSANAEYVKGYTGIDQETGKVFSKSLKGISQGKINPDYVDQNTKQQAGFSAEVAATSKDNAEAIINGSSIRTTRSDDHPAYGKDHEVVDRVKLLDGNIIDGSQSQMKFVGKRDELFKKIAEDTSEGNAKFARYRGIKLELPSEQYGNAAEYCRNKAQELRDQAEKAANSGAPPEVVERLRKNAENYDQLAENVVDSGLTTEDAIFYRNHPKLATARDIARTSHRAGIEGSKYGAVIGGCISLLTNAFAVAQEKKQLDTAAKNVLLDTGKGAVVGYATAATGAAIKGMMEQSPRAYVRTLSHTGAPALALNICISLSSSIYRYVNDEINERELLEEVGEKGTGMLSASMYAAIGQLVIPVPFVGAAIGGLIGYSLSSTFYQSTLQVIRQAGVSRVNLARVLEIETTVREEIAHQRATTEEFMRNYFPEMQWETQKLFVTLDTHIMTDMDIFAGAINSYAELLGAQLQFKSQMEFDHFMDSDAPLYL